jgi:hypothetical protein
MTSGGLRFREVMNGQLALRETEPEKGFSDESAYATSLQASIDIPDIDEFLAGGRHVGTLRAEVFIPVLGGRFVCTDGECVLFGTEQAPNPQDPPVRTMGYTAKLTMDDRIYKLHGRKDIEPGAPWRVWPATTTLNVTLQQVTDATGTLGPVVAAGILKLTFGAFMRQLATFQVTGDVRWFRRPVVIARYINFFGRMLVRTYLLQRPW